MEGLFIVELIHRAVDALQAEGRDDLGSHFQPLVNLFLLLIGPFSQDKIDLCATSVLVSDAEPYACVRVRS